MDRSLIGFVSPRVMPLLNVASSEPGGQSMCVVESGLPLPSPAGPVPCVHVRRGTTSSRSQPQVPCCEPPSARWSTSGAPAAIYTRSRSEPFSALVVQYLPSWWRARGRDAQSDGGAGTPCCKVRDGRAMNSFPVHEEGPRIARQRGLGGGQASRSDVPALEPARAVQRIVVLDADPRRPVSIKPGRNPPSQSQTSRHHSHQGPIERLHEGGLEHVKWWAVPQAAAYQRAHAAEERSRSAGLLQAEAPRQAGGVQGARWR